MVGADICGFSFTTTEELCAKWHAWGAYYTFSRNHNDINAADQYPYLWESVKDALVKNLNNKYSIIAYYYTLFYRAHADGGTVTRPVFFEFPKDSNTYALSFQFMIGSSFLFAPNLEENSTTVDVYLPASVWYDWWTGTFVSKDACASQTVTVDTPWDHVPIFLRGGSVIFQRSPELTLTKTLQNSLQLIVALDENEAAQGEVFFDNGSDLNVGAAATLVSLKAENGSISTEVNFDNYNGSEMSKMVSEVSVWGVSGTPTCVTINGISTSFDFNAQTQRLHVSLATEVSITDLAMSWK